MNKKAKKAESHSKRDHYAVALENIISQNRMIAEMITGINDKFDDQVRSLEKLRADVETLKAGVELLRADVEIIKGEVAIIRHNQVTRDEFKLLETRVARLEHVRR